MFNRTYWILFMEYLVMLTGFYMVIAILHGYTTQELSFTSETAGMIMGVFSFAAMVMRPFCGALCEKVDHRKLLRVSVLGLILSGTAYACTASVAVMIAARILNGAAFALASTVMIVEVYRSVPETQAGSAIGVIGLTNVIGASIGPFLGTRLLGPCGYFGVFAGSILFYVLMFLFIPGFRKEEKDPGKEKRKLTFQSFITVKVWHYAATGAVFAFLSAILSGFIISFGRELNGSDLSLFFSINAVAVFGIRLVGGKLYDKKGILAAGPPTMLVTAGALFLMGNILRLCPTAPTLLILVCGALMAVGQGIAWPALQTISLQSVEKEKSGAASGTYSLGADIGQMLGPVFAGFMLGSHEGITGYLHLFNTAGLIMTVAAAEFALYVFMKQKRKLKETDHGEIHM